MTDLLNMQGVARLTGIPYNTVRSLRHRGLMPKPARLVIQRGVPQPRWPVPIILAWKEEVGWPRVPGPKARAGTPEPRHSSRYPDEAHVLRPVKTPSGPRRPRASRVQPIPTAILPAWYKPYSEEFPEYAAWKRKQEVQRMTEVWTSLVLLSE